MLKRLQDYFLGKNISEFYNNRIEEHPEEAGSLRLEKDVSILYGKVLPNSLTLAGICTALFGGDIVISGIMICGSEAWRESAGEAFQFKERYYAIKDNCDAFEKAGSWEREKPKGNYEKYNVKEIYKGD